MAGEVGPVSGRALVTGASSGIGASFARELSARGWTVVLVARSAGALETLTADLPGPALPLAADLGTDAGLAAVEREIARAPVGLLVNNAATGRWGAFDELAVEHVDEALALNVRAPTRLARAALPAMVEAGSGGILTVSSGSGRGPAPMLAVYGATKSYLDALDASVRGELDRGRIRGVTITTVWPGYVTTGFGERMGDPAAGSDRMRTGPDAVARAALAAHARGRDTVAIPRPGPVDRVRAAARATAYRLPAPARRLLRTITSR